MLLAINPSVRSRKNVTSCSLRKCRTCWLEMLLYSSVVLHTLASTFIIIIRVFSSIAFLEVMMVEGLSFVVLGRVFFFLKSRRVNSQTQQVLLHLAAVTCTCTCMRVDLRMFAMKSCRSSRSTRVHYACEVLLQYAVDLHGS